MSAASRPRPLALVTGASRGIGAAIAQALARAGFDLLLTARDAAGLASAAADVEAAGGVARTVVADLATPAGIEAVRDAADDPSAPPAALVNNAGFGALGPFAEADPSVQLGMVDVNVRALTALTAAVLPGMIARGRGRILNVASLAAFQPGPNMAVYYASKAYVLSFSEALSEETRGAGVAVSALCPGLVRTDFQARAGMDGAPVLDRAPAMTPEAVAEAGVRGMLDGRRVIIPGAANRIAGPLGAVAPRGLLLPMLARLQRRGPR